MEDMVIGGVGGGDGMEEGKMECEKTPHYNPINFISLKGDVQKMVLLEELSVKRWGGQHHTANFFPKSITFYYWF